MSKFLRSRPIYTYNNSGSRTIRSHAERAPFPCPGLCGAFLRYFLHFSEALSDPTAETPPLSSFDSLVVSTRWDWTVFDIVTNLSKHSRQWVSSDSGKPAATLLGECTDGQRRAVENFSTRMVAVIVDIKEGGCKPEEAEFELTILWHWSKRPIESVRYPEPEIPISLRPSQLPMGVWLEQLVSLLVPGYIEALTVSQIATGPPPSARGPSTPPPEGGQATSPPEISPGSLVAQFMKTPIHYFRSSVPIEEGCLPQSRPGSAAGSEGSEQSATIGTRPSAAGGDHLVFSPNRCFGCCGSFFFVYTIITSIYIPGANERPGKAAAADVLTLAMLQACFAMVDAAFNLEPFTESELSQPSVQGSWVWSLFHGALVNIPSPPTEKQEEGTKAADRLGEWVVLRCGNSPTQLPQGIDTDSLHSQPELQHLVFGLDGIPWREESSWKGGAAGSGPSEAELKAAAEARAEANALFGDDSDGEEDPPIGGGGPSGQALGWWEQSVVFPMMSKGIEIPVPGT